MTKDSPRGATARLLLPLLMGLLLASAPRALAQVEVRAEIEPKKVGAGQRATFTIVVRGNRGPAVEPGLPRVPGLTFGNQNYSRQIAFGTGSARTLETFSFSVDSLEQGDYTIPPITLQIGGETYQTNAVSLEVTGTAERSALDPFLQMEPGKTRFYLGEIIPLKLTLFAHRMAPLRHHGMPEMEREGFVMKRFPQNPTIKYDELNGTIYQTVNFETSFSSIRPGKSQLGPASLEVIVDKPSGRSTFPSFFRNGESVRMKAVGNSVEVETIPLPNEGRPEGFTGAVGSYSLSTAASPLSLRVGDPISVDLVIRGRGNFEALTAPEPIGSKGLKLYPAKTFSEPERGTTAADLEQSVSFSQVIVPEEPLTELPAFSFSFFDPDTARYVTLESEPIAIEVIPDDRYTPPPTDSPGFAAGGGDTSPLAPAASPEVRYDEALHIIPGAEGSISRPLLPHRRTLFLAANAIPAIALGLLLIGAIRARRSPADTDSPAAEFDRILGELSSGDLDARDFYAQVHRGEQLATTLGGEPAPDSPAPALSAALAQHEATAYSGQAGIATPHSADRTEIISALRQLAGRR